MIRPLSSGEASAADSSQARLLYERYRRDLAKGSLPELLNRYRRCIEETRRVMERSRMVDCCAACARETAGGCCLEEVSGWYDPILLLINLLMGAEVPESPVVEGSCLWVGERGCRLLAHHSFCVNYLCPRLKSFLGDALTADFSATAGAEIQSGLEVENYLRVWIKEAKARRSA